jgi:hypothetical protein
MALGLEMLTELTEEDPLTTSALNLKPVWSGSALGMIWLLRQAAKNADPISRNINRHMGKALGRKTMAGSGKAKFLELVLDIRPHWKPLSIAHTAEWIGHWDYSLLN